MKNPWKSRSKVNPQCEDGYRRIENNVFKNLLIQGMTGSEWAVCMAVIDKTYGFEKLSDFISYKQLADITNFNRRTVIDAVKSLIRRRLLVVVQGPPVNQILFNKHYDTWVVVQRPLVVHRVAGGGAEGSKVVVQKVTNTPAEASDERKKETYTKERRIKTLKDKNPSVKILIDYYHDLFFKFVGIKPNIDGAKDGAILKRLVTKYNEDQVKSFLNMFFKSDDSFIQRSGYTIGVFQSQINKLIINQTKGPSLPPKSVANKRVLENLLKKEKINEYKKIKF